MIVVGMIFYASLYIVGFVWLLRHFHQPYEYAFERCVYDLETSATKWRISYHAINLVIFVVWWLGLMSANVCLTAGLVGAW